MQHLLCGEPMSVSFSSKMAEDHIKLCLFMRESSTLLASMPHSCVTELDQLNLSCMPTCKEELLRRISLLSRQGWSWTSAQMRAFNKLWSFLECQEQQSSQSDAILSVLSTDSIWRISLAHSSECIIDAAIPALSPPDQGLVAVKYSSHCSGVFCSNSDFDGYD
jgi:hypothetical protein